MARLKKDLCMRIIMRMRRFSVFGGRYWLRGRKQGARGEPDPKDWSENENEQAGSNRLAGVKVYISE